MKVTVLGCGRWGSFHAWYANRIGHDVLMWGREGTPHYVAWRERGYNDYMPLPKGVKLTGDLGEALSFADVCIIAISAQQVRVFAKELATYPTIKGKPLILCMKGLEIGTGKRLSVIIGEEIGDIPVAVWVGPGHIQDFLKGIPNCMVMASEDKNLTKELANKFSSSLIRFYYGEDLLGTEIGAAAKNVFGIGAGMLDALSYESLKGALMARGTRELSRLVKKMGGNPMTVYGLSHLGDYEATLFSKHSNNRLYGERLIEGVPMTKLAEGVYTSEAIIDLGKKYQIELPICETVYGIVCEEKDPKKSLLSLFMRSLTTE